MPPPTSAGGTEAHGRPDGVRGSLPPPDHSLHPHFKLGTYIDLTGCLVFIVLTGRIGSAVRATHRGLAPRPALGGAAGDHSRSELTRLAKRVRSAGPGGQAGRAVPPHPPAGVAAREPLPSSHKTEQNFTSTEQEPNLVLLEVQLRNLRSSCEETQRTTQFSFHCFLRS